MKKTLLLTAALLAAVTTASFAQKGPQGPGSPKRSKLNMADVRTIPGVVTAVRIGYGTQYPSIIVEQTAIKVAPLWFLLENEFEIQTGDRVTVLAAPSVLPNDSYLYAIEITNETGGGYIVLRDANGFPLWTATGGGKGLSAAQTSARCAQKTIYTVEGTVESLNMGLGIQMPTLVVKTDTGTLISMKLGPERFLLASDFELKVGDWVRAKYLFVSCTGQNFALELTNSAGDTLLLRDDTGRPVWR
jgi:hypothetical protein